MKYKITTTLLAVGAICVTRTAWNLTPSDCEKTERGILRSLDRHAYQKKVQAHIKTQANAIIDDSSMTEPPKRLKIEIMIDHNGNVTKINVLQSSEDEAFDRSMQEIVKKASPLPAPPCRVAEEVFKDGFIFEFK